MELSEKFIEILKVKNVSIDDIYENLKIPKKFLNALLEENTSEFPPDVYVVGYLKDISTFLNIDENELLELYTVDENKHKETKLKYEPILEIDKKRGTFKIFLTLIIFILIIVGVIFLFINRNVNNKHFEQSEENKNNIVDNISKNQIEKEDNLSNVTIDNLSNLKDNNSNITSSETENNTDKKLKLSEKQPDNNSAKNFENNYDNITSLKNKEKISEKKIILFATGKVWVRVTMDNKTRKTFLIKKGDTRKVKAKRFIKLDIGNAGNLKLYINGFEYPSVGRKGEVKHVTISLDNTSFQNYDNISE